MSQRKIPKHILIDTDTWQVAWSSAEGDVSGPTDMEQLTLVHAASKVTPTTPEPAPNPGGRPVAPALIRWLNEYQRTRRMLGREYEYIDKIIEKVNARTAYGILTYGQPLMTDSGRNVIEDLEQEIIDAMQYIMQARMEGMHSMTRRYFIDLLKTTANLLEDEEVIR